MEVIGLALASISIVVAIASATVAWFARGHSKRSADAAHAAELRAAMPRLSVEPEGDVARDATKVIYRVHHLEGPDLASVIVHRPEVGPADGGPIRYPVAATGRTEPGDTAEIGPIPIAQYARLTLSIGHGERLPAFRAKFTLRAEDGRMWTSAYSLATPRGPEQLRAEREQRERETETAQLATRQAVAEARGLSCYLLGGGGVGVDTSQWQMTSIQVHLRNDSETTASSILVSVIEDDDFEWKKPHPLGPGEATRHLVELQGALRDAPQSEASGKPLLSHTPRIAFKLNGRQYERVGDADPVIVEH